MSVAPISISVQYAFDPDSMVARRYSDLAQLVGETVIAVQAAEGSCPPDSLVERAKSRRSPLHQMFDWDNDVAGPKWRRHQARQIIAAVRIVRPDGSVDRSPTFVSVVDNRRDVPRRGYQSLVEVVRRPAGYGAALQQALDQLRGLERRYGHIEELRPVWRVIGSIALEDNGATEQ